MIIKRVIFVTFALIFSPVLFSKSNVSTLQADGPDQGLTAYELIVNFAGKRPIESPDLFPQNHPKVKHIYEDTDDIVGHHFVFLLHRDIDKDRDKYTKFSDRQRNEIKAYSGSKRRLKGYEDETLTYRWKFKLEPNMSLSKNFSHFFQLKSVDNGVGMPILTISGASYKEKRWLGLSHAAIEKSSILTKIPWEEASGEWLEAICKVTYSNAGSLMLKVKRMSDDRTIMSFESSKIDMWRGTEKQHFVRPKWGFYRSLKTKHMLEFEQDTIRFADFQVTKQINEG